MVVWGVAGWSEGEVRWSMGDDWMEMEYGVDVVDVQLLCLDGDWVLLLLPKTIQFGNA